MGRLVNLTLAWNQSLAPVRTPAQRADKGQGAVSAYFGALRKAPNNALK